MSAYDPNRTIPSPSGSDPDSSETYGSDSKQPLRLCRVCWGTLGSVGLLWIEAYPADLIVDFRIERDLIHLLVSPSRLQPLV